MLKPKCISASSADPSGQIMGPLFLTFVAALSPLNLSRYPFVSGTFGNRSASMQPRFASANRSSSLVTNVSRPTLFAAEMRTTVELWALGSLASADAPTGGAEKERPRGAGVFLANCSTCSKSLWICDWSLLLTFLMSTSSRLVVPMISLRKLPCSSLWACICVKISSDNIWWYRASSRSSLLLVLGTSCTAGMLDWAGNVSSSPLEPSEMSLGSCCRRILPSQRQR